MITTNDRGTGGSALTNDSVKPQQTPWYDEGPADGLGDRLLMFENSSAPTWEILQFKPALAKNHRFETAVRQRVDCLSAFHHEAFPSIRLVSENGLAVVSEYALGMKLSEVLKQPRSVEFGARLVRELVPALAALQDHSPGIAHGALTADRIVLSTDGRFVIREHMVGSALASLELPAAELWAQFGILVPTARASRKPLLDPRSDVTQLALMALSAMVGRCIGPDDYPNAIGRLLDQIRRDSNGDRPATFQALREWLERALQLTGRPFDSAREAQNALGELQFEPESVEDDFGAIVTPTWPANGGTIAQASPQPQSAKEEQPPTPQPKSSSDAGPAGDWKPPLVETRSARERHRRYAPPLRWIAAAAGALVVAEAAIIGWLLFTSAPSQPFPGVEPASESRMPRAEVDAHAAAMPTLAAAPPPPSSEIPALKQAAPRVAPEPRETRAAATPPPAAPARNGGFRISAPVEIHVVDGDRVIGSSLDGVIIVERGPRELEFVNPAIGYRGRQLVDIKPGEIESLSITVPNGNLNINAVPWAAVWIDGESYGETPLGNLSIPPGEHEIVFRHPELGERRQKAIVRVDGTTRVSMNLQQQ